MEENPFEPPKTEIFKEQLFNTNNIASTSQRFVNYIVDRIALLAITFVLGFIIGMIEIVFETSIINTTNRITNYIFSFIVGFTYYVAMETIFGKTIGKVITRTRVIADYGKKPTLLIIVKRTLCRFIPFEPLSFLTGNGFPEGWHDRFSDTLVISTKENYPILKTNGYKN